MTTKPLVTTLAVLALTALCVPDASAQKGAKALFYGSSGATLRSDAPASAPNLARPDPPTSNLATGYPSSPAPPGPMPSPAPVMPAMAPPPPPAPPTAPPAPPRPALASPAPPTVGPPSGGQASADLTKIVDELKAAADNLPPAPPGSVAASADQGTKDLSVERDGPIMGVKYWVELLDAKGVRRRVTTDHIFRAGDRIKLHVTTNRDGHLTLVNVGTTGRTAVLFPSGGANNFVTAGANYEVPQGGFMRFDANPGQELLILTLSPQAAVPTPATALAMARGAKDLVTEVDASSAQPATYAVAPGRAGQNAGTIAIQIKLTHR